MGMMFKKAQVAEYHLNVHERLISLLETYHVVRLEDDDFPERLTWCLEKCQHKFRDLSEQGQRAWYFEDEKDAAMFALKWSGE
jgi:hypothetical protein